MTKKRMTPKEAGRVVGKSLMDLNAFYAIIAICEGGCFHAPSHYGVQQIIAICKRETAKRLAEHDAALEVLTGERP